MNSEPRETDGLDARRIYYVYYWKRVGDTYPFYVGKGKRDRAFTTTGRNPYFTNIHSKNDCEVTIVVNSLDEMLAYEIEKALIQYFWKLGHCEANLQEGGTGGNIPYKAEYGKPRKKVKTTSKFKKVWITPAGKFRTSREAAEANGCDCSTVSRRSRNPKFPEWKLIIGEDNE